ncbi:UNVERIFIED_ORG: sigma-70-like protein [Zoogloea ramigera]
MHAMTFISIHRAGPAWPPDAGTFYGQHHGWLLGWLRKKLGCGHHAADLAQDTFLRVLITPRADGCNRAQQLLPALREPRAYLTTVASRLLLNHYRRLSLDAPTSRRWRRCLNPTRRHRNSNC